MKDKKYLIIGAVTVLLIVVLGGAYMLSKSNSSKQATPSSQSDQEMVGTLQPSDIGLTLSPITTGKFADHGVTMTITKTSDIASVDYTLSYTSTGNIPRGVLGHIDAKGGTITQDLPFGTCSDVCHFDQGVSGVSLTLKVVKKDGKAYQVEQSYTPPSQ